MGTIRYSSLAASAGLE
jgi:hypothetical protein